MKKTVLILLTAAYMFADTHYAQLKPFESYKIKAAVSGSVVDVKSELEGKQVQNTLIVQVDSAVDAVQLRALKVTLQQVQNQIQINQGIVANQEESLKREKAHFERVNSLETRPQTEKDSAFYSYINAQNQLLSTKEKLSSLIDKKESTKHSIANLEDTIEKKQFVLSGLVDSIAIREGDFVNQGALVATVKDVSKGKLELFLNADELEHSQVFLNGKHYEKGFSKIWKTTDDTHLSSYKAQIIIEDTDAYRFGELIKIEVK